MKKIAFTGHRPYSILQHAGYDTGDRDNDTVKKLKRDIYGKAVNSKFMGELADKLISYIENSGETDFEFRVGGAQGMDTVAFWAIQKAKSALKTKGRDDISIKTTVYLPFLDYGPKESPYEAGKSRNDLSIQSKAWFDMMKHFADVPERAVSLEYTSSATADTVNYSEATDVRNKKMIDGVDTLFAFLSDDDMVQLADADTRVSSGSARCVVDAKDAGAEIIRMNYDVEVTGSGDGATLAVKPTTMEPVSANVINHAKLNHRGFDEEKDTSRKKKKFEKAKGSKLRFRNAANLATEFNIALNHLSENDIKELNKLNVKDATDERHIEEFRSLAKITEYMAARGVDYELVYEKYHNRVRMNIGNKSNSIVIATSDDEEGYYGSGYLFGDKYYLSYRKGSEVKAGTNRFLPYEELQSLVDCMLGDVKNLKVSNTLTEKGKEHNSTNNRLELNAHDAEDAILVTIKHQTGYSRGIDEYIEIGRQNLQIEDIIAAGPINYREVTTICADAYEKDGFFDRLDAEVTMDESFETTVNRVFDEMYRNPVDVDRLSSIIVDEDAKDKITKKIMMDIAAAKKKGEQLPYTLSPETQELIDYLTVVDSTPRLDRSALKPEYVALTDSLTTKLKAFGLEDVNVSWLDDGKNTIVFEFTANGEKYSLVQNDVLLQGEEGYIMFDGKMVVPENFAYLDSQYETLGDNTIIERHNARVEKALAKFVEKNVILRNKKSMPSDFNALHPLYKAGGEYVTELSPLYNDENLDNYLRRFDELSDEDVAKMCEGSSNLHTREDLKNEWLRIRNGFKENLIKDFKDHRIKYTGTTKEYTISRSLTSADGVNDINQASIRFFEEADAEYFDVMCSTSNSPKNVGVIRYLSKSASIGEDGRLVKGNYKDTTNLFDFVVENFPGEDHISIDRWLMDLSYFYRMQDFMMSRICYTSAQGITDDDGGCISSKQARLMRSVSPHEGFRDVWTGDKMAPLGGNKGIQTVMDVDSEPDEKDFYYATKKFMKDNGVDFIFPTTSCMSRTNPQSLVYGLEKPETLMSAQFPDGHVEDSFIMRGIVMTLSEPCDKKTHIYEYRREMDDNCKISNQHDWLFSLYDVPNVRAELAMKPMTDEIIISERMRCVGYAINDDSSISRITLDDIKNNGYLASVPDAIVNDKGQFHNKNSREVIEDFMQSLPVNSYIKVPNKAMFAGLTAFCEHDDEYCYLPVPSANVICGSYYSDSLHKNAVRLENSEAYMTIIEAVMRDRGGFIKDEDEMASRINSSMAKIQAKYEHFINDKKANIFRDKMQYHKVGTPSAAAVWVAEPTLDLDEIGMTRENAKKLRVEDGEYVCVSRHPIIEEHSSVGMRVKILPDSLVANDHCMKVNPCVAPMFRGDFDGDKAIIFTFRNPECQKELQSIDVYHSLFKSFTGDVEITTNLDVAHGLSNMGQTFDESIFEPIRQAIADGVQDLRPVCKPLNDYLREAHKNAVGPKTMIGSTPEQALKRCIDIEESGMKGNIKKVTEYFLYAGYDVTIGDDGSIADIKKLDTEYTYGQTKAAESSANVGAKGEAPSGSGTNTQNLVGCAHALIDNKAMSSLQGKATMSVTECLTQAALDSKQNGPLSMLRFNCNVNAVAKLIACRKIDESTLTKEALSKDASEQGGIQFVKVDDDVKAECLKRLEKGNLNKEETLNCINGAGLITRDEYLRQIYKIHEIMECEDIYIDEAWNIVADAFSKDINGVKVMVPVDDVLQTTTNCVDRFIYGRNDNMAILEDIADTGAKLYNDTNICVRTKYPSSCMKKQPVVSQFDEEDLDAAKKLAADASKSEQVGFDRWDMDSSYTRDDSSQPV